ncbi:MAG: hypothetical protein Satyrvirus22_2 [Satyrvirus sp.]|uniref:DUF305 domain-containing protein n=1 Tax=Satyrvirus sp. TaxID=2487771 RepID=A0A3G5AEH7_9VIRU|nr:MAG: hypothetical protein Satyrvirus22_2 [Satyrvirus sp.]
MDSYKSIFLMVAVSFIAGYLSTMNMWTVDRSHARWHLNDFYMVLMMVCWMIIFGFIFMGKHMFSSKIVLVISIILVILLIYAIRNQIFINDAQFLNGMISHHSMAILMAEKIRDKTKDPRVKSLANNIIKSQLNEINLMTKILDETGKNNYVF